MLTGRSQVTRSLAVAVLIGGALLPACTNRVSHPEVEGVYVAEYKNGTEKLTLEKGGKFVQEVTLKGSQKPTVNVGQWRYRVSENSVSARIDLEDCLAVGDGFGAIRPDFATSRGGCSFPVERRWFVLGRLRLGPDEASALWKVN
jgi:hypothetical protein